MPTPATRSLQRYRAKRDFAKTPEPAGAPRRSKQQLEFVIQRHHARRLHYDFRLEWEGVLKSWAVPKGPSLDPADKRLAVQVEDHPFEYRKFSGDIPAGEYGAGHVIIWDRGRWVPEGDVDKGLRAGKLDFALHGERLQGSWTLVRLNDDAPGKQNWLLIKRRDEHAVTRAHGPQVTELYTQGLDQPSGPGSSANGPKSAQNGGGKKGSVKNVGAKNVGAQNVGAQNVDAQNVDAKKDGANKGGRSAAKFVAPATPPVRAEPSSASRKKNETAAASGSIAKSAARRVDRRVVFSPPQLATAVEAFPTEGRWVTELKFDGYRILAYVDGERVRCFSRGGLDWTHRMPAVAQALAACDLRDAWLDGELIAADENGVPRFERLQQAFDPSSGDQALVLMVFDLLQLMGADLRPKPWRERRRLLEKALAAAGRDGPVRLVDFIDDANPALRDRACGQGYEGVILKDPEATYRPGRNRAWLKVKCRREQEFVIGGYTRTSAGRQTLTALLLGYYDRSGQLQFAGRAGTGFSENQLAGLRKQLDRLAQSVSPFAAIPKLRHSERPQWVKPELVAQVRFAEWTEAGILRQPLFLGLREDKAAIDVTREPDAVISKRVASNAKTVASKANKRARPATPQGPTSAASARRNTTKPFAKAIAKPRAQAHAVPRDAKADTSPARARNSRDSNTALRRSGQAALTLTHPQRVLFPTDGVTKQQLADYYEAVAAVLWPHLRSRPLSVIRATSGQGRVFFQRHIEGTRIPGLTPVEIPSSEVEPYFVCSSEAEIPLLAQMGAVELHTWGSRMPRPEAADRITFDLDPDPTLPWPRVREAVTLVRGMLQELGLQSLLKTSGGMGMHVVVPLLKGPSLEMAAAFSRRLAEHLARVIPERFSAKRGAPNRQGRIYVDWQRNQFAATTVCAYSPRYRPGVPVSMPIDWDELGKTDIRGPHFNLRTVAARVAERGDAWAALPPIRQSLTKRVIDRLERAAVP